MTPLMVAFSAFSDDPHSKAKVRTNAEGARRDDGRSKRRPSSRMTATEVAEVLRLGRQKQLSQREIAEHVGVSLSSVTNVNRRSRAEPGYLERLFDEAALKRRVVDSCLQVVERRKASGVPIWSVPQLQEELQS